MQDSSPTETDSVIVMAPTPVLPSIRKGGLVSESDRVVNETIDSYGYNAFRSSVTFDCSYSWFHATTYVK